MADIISGFDPVFGAGAVAVDIIVGRGVVMEDVGAKVAGRKEAGVGLVVDVGALGIKQTLAFASGAKSFKSCISSTVKNS